MGKEETRLRTREMSASPFAAHLSLRARQANRWGARITSAAMADFYQPKSNPGGGLRGKPPNVLLYSADDADLFEQARQVLVRQVLDKDGCVVYRLTDEEARRTPWADNASALVLLRSPACQQVRARVLEFLSREKTPSGLLHWSEDPVIQEQTKFVQVKTLGDVVATSSALAYQCRPSSSDPGILRSIFSLFNLPLKAASEESSPPPLTPGFLLCQDEGLRRRLLSQGNAVVAPVHETGKVKEKRVTFYKSLDEITSPSTSHDVHVVTQEAADSFDPEAFFEHLSTRDIGRALIHSPVIGTGFDLLGTSPLVPGRSLAVIPDTQLSGKGRGGNAWISPPGCAMFCLQFAVKQSSLLGQRACILCHLVALAIVRGVKKLTAEKGADVDVRIKWPNDIYVGRDTKIGGILLYNHCGADNDMLFSVGVGVNLDNRLPTMCINRALREATGDDKAAIPREAFLAEVFNSLELVLDDYQRGGQERLKKEYYSHWLHSGQEVGVRFDGQEDGEATPVTITGIDDFGFLAVRDESGRRRTVHPDGNTFDMMKNLILPK